MQLEQLIPTVGEIALNAIDSDRDRVIQSSFNSGLSRFYVGDEVKFLFNGKWLIGHITNLFNHNGETTYHIVTPSHKWYQHINQEFIIRYNR